MKINFKKAAWITSIALSSFCFAGSMGQEETDKQQLRFSAYLGSNWAHLSPSYIYLPDEEDYLNASNHPTDISWGLSAAYHWLTPDIYPLRLHDISLGIDMYYFNTKQTGQTWQYLMPTLYNYDYQLKLSSLRFLLNSEWTFQPLPLSPSSHTNQIYPFVDLGLGLAQNALSYNDTPVPTLGGQGLVIDKHTTTQFAWDVGAGLKMPFKTKQHSLEASLRYLYTDLGHARTAETSNAFLTAPLRARLSSQAVVLGLSIFI